jgi:hypothetical protein
MCHPTSVSPSLHRSDEHTICVVSGENCYTMKDVLYSDSAKLYISSVITSMFPKALQCVKTFFTSEIAKHSNIANERVFLTRINTFPA